MPTTQEEAHRIVTITQEYIQLDKMAELYSRLNNEVGKKTDNDSLKQSLFMMDQLVGAAANTVVTPPTNAWMYWLALNALVITHGFLVLGMMFSFLALPFLAHWYVAIPLCTFIWFFSTSRIDCKLTHAENYLRAKLGKKRIGGFIGHYFIRPLKRQMTT